MTKTKWLGLFLIIVAIMAFIAAIFMNGIWMTKDYIQKEAIENNAAEWTIDPKTGDRKFTWKKGD